MSTSTRTRIGFIADVHVGNHKKLATALPGGLNSRCLETVDTLERAVKRAKQLRLEKLFILGDLYDTDAPTPQLVYAVQQALSSSLEIIIATGNHDVTSDTENDHALMPLAALSNVTIYTEPVTELPVALVPYHSGPSAEWFEEAVAKACQYGGSVLAFHAGIIDGDTPPWLCGGGAVHVDEVLRLLKKHNLSAAFAGDYHTRKVWEREGKTVMQVGSLCPTGFCDPGLEGYGTLAVWDSDSGLSHEELPGPRFVKTRSADDGKTAVAVAKQLGHKLYLQHVDNGDGEWEQVDGVVFENVPDGVDATIAARSAAMAAKSGDTLVESLDGFVREMALPDGVRRERVLELCRGYLGQ